MAARAPAVLALLAAWLLASNAWAQQQLTRPDEPSAQAKGGFAEPEARPPAPPLSAEVQDTLRRINAYRAAGATCGSQAYPPAPPLTWNGLLEKAAQAHAQDMAGRRTMSHTGGDGSSMSERVGRVGYTWGALGENVSAGYTSIPAGLEGWMKSPGHCSNIMGAQFREVGVGAANAPGDTFGWYRAMVLGTPR
jgi:uncharacterized protein YkwD